MPRIGNKVRVGAPEQQDDEQQDDEQQDDEQQDDEQQDDEQQDDEQQDDEQLRLDEASVAIAPPGADVA